MQHEIIMSLAGIPGDIIIDNGNNFIIDNNIDFITQSEKELLLKIIQVGYHYKYLNEFVSLCNSSKREGINNLPNCINYIFIDGLYLRGFSYCLQDILIEYGNDLREIERIYMKDNTLSLLFLYHKIQKVFIIIFNSIEYYYHIYII